MKTVRILIPIGIGLLLLLGGSGCISDPALSLKCNDLIVSGTAGTNLNIDNPCVGGGAWAANDTFSIALPQLPNVSIVKYVLATGEVKRQIVVPNIQPWSQPFEGGFAYAFDNGGSMQGFVSLTILPPLQITLTATPAIIAAGQTTHLQATVTGGTPPYSYSWAPLITPVNFPTLDAAPKQNTTFTITVTDYTGRSKNASVDVTVNSSVPAPVIAGISPAQGLIGGGTFVTITGDNFQAGVTVQFGAAPGQDGSVVERDARTITALTPPGSGTVDVTVTNPDKQSATLPRAFTYFSPLTASLTATPQVLVRDATSQSRLQVIASGGVPFASGPPYVFQWSPDPAFPDLSGLNPAVRPAATSVFTILVSDSLSNSASASVLVTVFGAALQACLATLPPDQTVTHGVPVIFNAACSTGPNPIKLFEWWASWNPANPTLPDASGQFLLRPVFTYPGRGRGMVRLQVTDVTGATSAATYGFIIE